MHEHEVVVTMEMARELVNDQFPAYAGCALTPVQSLGTVNVLYRLGTEMLLRFPRVIDWATVDKECKWIPYLAPHLPLRVPEPVALGQPTDQYPCIWGIFRWIPGDLYLDVGVQDEADAACRVCGFRQRVACDSCSGTGAVCGSPAAERTGRQHAGSDGSRDRNYPITSDSKDLGGLPAGSTVGGCPFVDSCGFAQNQSSGQSWTHIRRFGLRVGWSRRSCARSHSGLEPLWGKGAPCVPATSQGGRRCLGTGTGVRTASGSAHHSVLSGHQSGLCITGHANDA